MRQNLFKYDIVIFFSYSFEVSETDSVLRQFLNIAATHSTIQERTLRRDTVPCPSFLTILLQFLRIAVTHSTLQERTLKGDIVPHPLF